MAGLLGLLLAAAAVRSSPAGGPAGVAMSLSPAAPEELTTTTTTVAVEGSSEAPSSTPAAVRLCEARLAQFAGRDNPWGVVLVAAYPSTAADVAADEERRGEGVRSSWRDRPPAEFAAVCWFDADAFGVAPDVRDGAGDDARFVDRIQEVIGPDGAPVVHQAGRKDTLVVAPIPPAGDGQ